MLLIFSPPIRRGWGRAYVARLGTPTQPSRGGRSKLPSHREGLGVGSCNATRNPHPTSPGGGGVLRFMPESVNRLAHVGDVVDAPGAEVGEELLAAVEFGDYLFLAESGAGGNQR